MRSVIALVLALILLPSACLATVPSYVSTIVLQDGVSPAADSDFFWDTFICSSAADSGLNHGAAETLRVNGPAYSSTWKGGTSKSLVSVDIAGALADSAVIVRARLWMYQIDGGAGTTPVDTLEIVECLRTWTEGTGGNNGSAQASSADWNNYTGAAWLVAGASGAVSSIDFMKQWTATDSVTVGYTMVGLDTMTVENSNAVGRDVSRISNLNMVTKSGTLATRRGWVCIDVTREANMVQRGVRARLNVVIQRHNEDASTRPFAFASSEATYRLTRPKLEIQYVLVTAGSGDGGSIHIGEGEPGVRN